MVSWHIRNSPGPLIDLGQSPPTAGNLRPSSQGFRCLNAWCLEVCSHSLVSHVSVHYTYRAGENALPSQLPTRVGYTPNFTDPDADQKDILEGVANKKQSAENNSISTGNKKKVSVDVSAGPSLAPTAAVPPVRQTSTTSSSFSPELPFQTGFRSSTPATPDLEASFPPPILVTPPSTPRTPGNRPLRRRPVTRPPWKSGDRPPRPPGRPIRPKNTPPTARPPGRPIRPQSSLATPPLRTAQRPLVFPSQSQSYRGGEPVIVTGVAIPADNDIIDLTVTAQQGFGGRRPKPKKKYPGEFMCFYMHENWNFPWFHSYVINAP